MIRKLPKWVWFGGAVLAFVAGMINVVGLISFEKTPVSHMTGNTTQFALLLARGDWPKLGFFGAILGSFIFGAVMSGALLRSSTLQLGRRYSAALMLESGLLALAVVVLQRDSVCGIFLLSCACGLQNGMAATYSGAIVRTTHMTGLFTDLGVLIGHWLRGLEFDFRRIGLCVALIGGFLSGAVFETAIFPSLNYRSLLIPVAITLSAAVGYAAYQHRVQSANHGTDD